MDSPEFATELCQALNTLIVESTRVPGEHELFVCADAAEAKASVIQFLREQFGWQRDIDWGPLSSACGTEELMLAWLRLYSLFKTADLIDTSRGCL